MIMMMAKYKNGYTYTYVYNIGADFANKVETKALEWISF